MSFDFGFDLELLVFVGVFDSTKLLEPVVTAELFDTVDVLGAL